MDSTLVAGLLSRVDLVAQKVGIGAEHLWALWVSTSWRPAVGVLWYLVLGVFLGLVAAKAARIAMEAPDMSGREIVVGMISGICGVLAIVSTGAALFSIPDALVFLTTPELYAVRQFTDLLHGGAK